MMRLFRSLGCFCAVWALTLPAFAQQPPAVEPAPDARPFQGYVLRYKPFGRNFSQIPIVATQLNNAFPANFCFDTGSNMCMVARDVTDKMHLAPLPRTKVHEMMDGAPETYVPLQITLQTISFDAPASDDNHAPHSQRDQAVIQPVNFDMLPVVVKRTPHLMGIGANLDGIFGTTAFDTLKVAFNFQKHIIVLMSGGSLTNADRADLGFGGAQAIPLKKSNELYSVSITLTNGFRRQTLDLLVDTGSDNTIIPNKVAEALQLQPDGRTIVSDGPLSSDPATQALATLSVGDQTLTQQAVNYPTNGKEQPPRLGLDMLSKFKVLMDFPGKKMYLVLVPLTPVVQVKPASPPVSAAPVKP